MADGDVRFRMRESFLRELMILQSASLILSADSAQPQTGSDSASSIERQLQPQPPANNQPGRQREEKQEQSPTEEKQALEQHSTSPSPPLHNSTNEQQQQQLIQQTTTKEQSSTNDQRDESSAKNADKIDDHHNHKQVNITLLAESGSTGRSLSGFFVACDSNLTHILLNDLKTPIGIQSSALVRLNDVIAITYR